MERREGLNLADKLRGEVECSRCRGPLAAYSEDRCWWCLAPLCEECWIDPGTCAACEVEAAEVLRRLADRRRLSRQAKETQGIWNLKKLARFLGLHPVTVAEQCLRYCIGDRVPVKGGGVEWRFSQVEVDRLVAVKKIAVIRRSPQRWELLYKPPWPEWLRVRWQERGIPPLP